MVAIIEIDEVVVTLILNQLISQQLIAAQIEGTIFLRTILHRRINHSTILIEFIGARRQQAIGTGDIVGASYCSVAAVNVVEIAAFLN